MAKRYIREKGWPGHIDLKQEYVQELGRHATVADMIQGSSGKAWWRLTDADLDWMGEDRFSLVGLKKVDANKDEPETAYKGAWLCFFNDESRRKDDGRR